MPRKKSPPKSVELVVKCFSRDEYHGDTGCDYAIIYLDASGIMRLLTLMKNAEKAQKLDKEFHCQLYWDSTPVYFCDSPEFDLKMNNDVLVCTFEETGLNRDELEIARTECDQIVVKPERVSWQAYPKHTSVVVETEVLTKDYLMELFLKLTGE